MEGKSRGGRWRGNQEEEDGGEIKRRKMKGDQEEEDGGEIKRRKMEGKSRGGRWSGNQEEEDGGEIKRKKMEGKSRGERGVSELKGTRVQSIGFYKTPCAVLDHFTYLYHGHSRFDFGLCELTDSAMHCRVHEVRDISKCIYMLKEKKKEKETFGCSTDFVVLVKEETFVVAHFCRCCAV
jgi:hypothetical protein